MAYMWLCKKLNEFLIISSRRSTMCEKFIWLSTFVLVLGLSGNVFAVTTWTGAQGTSDWFDPCNWTPIGVPTSADWTDITGNHDFSTIDNFDWYQQTGYYPYEVNDLRYTWHHGEEDFSSGSVISLVVGPGGADTNSLKYDYDNTGGADPCFSEISRYSPVTDMTTGTGTITIDVNYLGNAGNDCGETERMYLGLSDVSNNFALAYNPDPDAAKVTDWTHWSLDVAAFTAGANDVNMKGVSKFYIGFGDPCNTTTAGGTVPCTLTISQFPFLLPLSRFRM